MNLNRTLADYQHYKNLAAYNHKQAEKLDKLAGGLYEKIETFVNSCNWEDGAHDWTDSEHNVWRITILNGKCEDIDLIAQPSFDDQSEPLTFLNPKS